MVNYKEICEKCQEIALAAAQFIEKERKNFTLSAVEHKSSDRDLVSYVDKGAEKIVVSALKPLIEGARFITEEKTVENGVGSSSFCWVIDPLDGTTNFVHNLAPYCVSIALMEGDEVVVGVVYEVCSHSCYYSWKGGGSYVNGEPIFVSATDSISDSLFCIGYSYGTEKQFDRFEKVNNYIANHSHGFRRTGSAAANVIFVACGKTDGFSQVNLSAWDIAGGVIIAKNAGAVVSTYSGGDNYIFGGEIVVATPKIYEDYIKIIKGEF